MPDLSTAKAVLAGLNTRYPGWRDGEIMVFSDDGRAFLNCRELLRRAVGSGVDADDLVLAESARIIAGFQEPAASGTDQGKAVGGETAAILLAATQALLAHFSAPSLDAIGRMFAAIEPPPTDLSEIGCHFTRGYVAAAFFSTFIGTEDGGGEALQRNFRICDMAMATWSALRRDCEAFLAVNRALIEACGDTHRRASPVDDAMSHAGRDFWYTREGHRCGFGDGGWPRAAGGHLAAAAKSFGPADWYVGGNGLIYQTGCERFAPVRAPDLVPPPESAFPGSAGRALGWPWQ
jgi:hypothetical protein